MKVLLKVFLILFIVAFLCAHWYIAYALVIAFLAWKIYETLYFKGSSFTVIKERISSYIDDCNSLNNHIEELKHTSLIDNRIDYGAASYQHHSISISRKDSPSKREYTPNIHYCSKTVCDNASREPFKYICKYFNIEADESTLGVFESVLNNFEAAEEGKLSLLKEKDKILQSIDSDIPFLIKKLCQKKLDQELGFEPIDLSTAHFPVYSFRYQSAGGRSSDGWNIIMDIENLNKFVEYLSNKIKFQKSAAGQRALMTSKLRLKIKERDGYTCKCCGLSTTQEPHLLLEVDHIIPISKGGLTTEDNLQTLCWKCNRSKGSKI